MQDYPGVNTVTRALADGSRRAYHYHRATGRRLPGERPVHGEPWNAEQRLFNEAYLEAEAAATSPARPGERLFPDLVDEFLDSPEHLKRTSRRTQIERERALEAAKVRFPRLTIADLSDRRIRDEIFRWRDSMQATPRKADWCVASMSRLLGWAYDRGMIEYNHGSRIGTLVPPGHNRSSKIWTLDAEKILLAKAPRSVRDLYLFALYTGARESDIAALNKANFDGRWLSFVPAKTAKHGIAVFLPVYLMPPLADLLAGHRSPGDHLLAASRGQRWTDRNIRDRFLEAVHKAKLHTLGLHFHDIRGTADTRLAEAGCTEAERAVILGHAIGGSEETGRRVGMSGRYTARTKTLAENAYRKWAEHMGYDENVTRLEVVKSAAAN